MFISLTWPYPLPPTLHLQGIKRLPVACKIMAHPLPFVQLSAYPSVSMSLVFQWQQSQLLLFIFVVVVAKAIHCSCCCAVVPCVVDRCQEKLIFRQIQIISHRSGKIHTVRLANALNGNVDVSISDIYLSAQQKQCNT